MTTQPAAMKPLLVATLATMGTSWVLGFLVLLMGLGSSTAMNSLVVDQIYPVNLLTTTLSMGVGDYVDGKRFIGVAPVIMVMLWFTTVLILCQMARPMQRDATPHVLVYNRMQIVMSLPAASAGAAMGAWARVWRALGHNRLEPCGGLPSPCIYSSHPDHAIQM